MSIRLEFLIRASVFPSFSVQDPELLQITPPGAGDEASLESARKGNVKPSQLNVPNLMTLKRISRCSSVIKLIWRSGSKFIYNSQHLFKELNFFFFFELPLCDSKWHCTGAIIVCRVELRAAISQFCCMIQSSLTTLLSKPPKCTDRSYMPPALALLSS